MVDILTMLQYNKVSGYKVSPPEDDVIFQGSYN